MTRKYIAIISIIIGLSFSAVCGDKNQTLTVKPRGRLLLQGTSTLHDFTCASTTIQGVIGIEADQLESNFAGPRTLFSKVDISIPVKGINSGNSSMDENMYEALKEEKFPTITFSMLNVRALMDSLAEGGVAKLMISGKLNISGKENRVEIPVQAEKAKEGTLNVFGLYELLMSSYDIDPPSFFLGTLKVGDKMLISFELLLETQNPLKTTTSSSE